MARLLESAQKLISAGVEDFEKYPVAAEMLQGVLYSMLVARVRSRHRNLRGMEPTAIYITLAPFLGPEEAYRHAVGRRGRRRSRRGASDP